MFRATIQLHVLCRSFFLLPKSHSLAAMLLATWVLALFPCQRVVAQAASKPTAASIEFVEEDPTPPRIREYDQKRKIFLRHSRSKDPQVQQAAIYNLCHLHLIVTADPRFRVYNKLQSVRASIYRRLVEWQRKQLADVKDKSPDAFRRLKMNRGSEPAGDFSVEQQSLVERGQLDDAVTERAKETFVPFPFAETPQDDLDREMLFAAARASQISGDIVGGPKQMFRYHGGQFGAPWDHAPDLIALIKATITPDVWAESGGTATIRYYQPALALIVRAPQETQDDICEFLMTLRAAF